MPIRVSVGGNGAGSGLNWGATSTWKDATVPITGDGVLFGPGNHVVGSGLAQSGVSLNRLLIHPLASVEFTDTLEINVNNGTNPYVDHRGRGTLPISGTITTAVLRGPRGGLTLEGGTTTTLYGSAGEILVQAAAALTNFYARGADADVKVHASSRISVLRQSAGTVKSERDIVNGRQTGPSTLRLYGSASIADGTSPNPVAEHWMEHPRALLQFTGDADEAGDFYVLEGEVDLDEHEGDLDVEDLWRGPNGRFPTEYRAGDVTVNGSQNDLGVNEPGRAR